MKTRNMLKVAAVSAMTAALMAGSVSAAQMEDGLLKAGEGAGEGYKIALIQAHQLNAFQTAITEAAEAAAEELGVELTVLSADQDAATQIGQIEQCTAEEYDAILFEPVDPDAMGSAAKEAADAGIVVVNIVSSCTDWEDYGISVLSCGDNTIAGKTEMEHVAELLDGKGNIAILTGPSGDSGGLDRLHGYEEVLEEYPDIVQVVEPADCGWDTASAQATVESWMSAYEIDAIISENDSMAVGAGNAVGADSGVIVTGVDGTPDGFEAIKDGRMTGTVSQSAGDMAANGMNAAVLLLNGEELEDTTLITNCVWIDAENVADYE